MYVCVTCARCLCSEAYMCVRVRLWLTHLRNSPLAGHTHTHKSTSAIDRNIEHHHSTNKPNTPVCAMCFRSDMHKIVIKLAYTPHIRTLNSRYAILRYVSAAPRAAMRADSKSAPAVTSKHGQFFPSSLCFDCCKYNIHNHTLKHPIVCLTLI